MKQLIKIIQCKKGNSTLYAVIIALAILIISCAIFEYIRLMIIAQGVRDSVQSAIIGVVVENYDNVYMSLREGYSGSYDKNGSTWDEYFDEGDIYKRIDDVLGLIDEGAFHVKYTEDVEEYKVSELDINIINAPFAPTSRENEFQAEAKIHLEVPLSFGWQMLPSMKINLNCKAVYMPKF